MRWGLIYLDTHVVVWLYAGLTGRFSASAHSLINKHDLYISPIVRLELQYLAEIERITAQPEVIVDDLVERVGLQICDQPFDRVVTHALAQTWTRDPFDRLIVANASVKDAFLLSKDEQIRANYDGAKW